MIPKLIHFIWLGKGGKPKNFSLVYKSWKTYAASFEIKEWNEESLEEFNLPPYFYKAMKERKWAFASDVLRFYILEKYGGIYLDIDELLLKSIESNELLGQSCFLGKYHEVDTYFGFGFIGSVPCSDLVSRMVKYYEGYQGEKDTIVNAAGSKIALAIKKEDPLSITFFPQEYFYPLTQADQTHHTYAKHLSNTSWIPRWKKVAYKIPGYFLLKKFFFALLPKKIRSKITRINY